MGLSLRLSLAILAILAMALVLTASLSYFQFEDTLTELRSSRIAVIALDIKQTIEDSTTNRDLPLKNYELYREFIERAQKGDPEIRSLVVFDRLGTVLPYPSSATVPASWANANIERCNNRAGGNQPAQASLWKLSDTDALIVGAALCTAFHTLIGGVGVEYSRASHRAMLTTVMVELGKAAGFVFVGFAALTVLAVFLVFQPLTRATKRMDTSLSMLLQEDGSMKPAADALRTPLERDFTAFRGRLGDALAALSEAERNLDKR